MKQICPRPETSGHVCTCGELDILVASMHKHAFDLHSEGMPLSMTNKSTEVRELYAAIEYPCNSTTRDVMMFPK